MKLKRSNILLSIVCLLSLCFMFVGYAVLSETLKISGSVVAYKSYNGITLNGMLDDSIWTEEVKRNSIDINSETGNTLIDLYVTRTNDEICFFASYYTKILKNAASDDTEWWMNDNIEFRIVDPTNNYVRNKNSGVEYQYYISTIKSANASTFTDFYITDPVFNPQTGYYEIKFEWVLAYSHMKRYNPSTGAYDDSLAVDANTKLGFYVLSNPADGNVFATWNMGTQSNIPSKAYAYSHKITKYGIGQTGSPMTSLNLPTGYVYQNRNVLIPGVINNFNSNGVYETLQDGFDPNGIKIYLDSNYSWDLEVKFRNYRHTVSGTPENYQSFVGEVGTADPNGNDHKGVFSFRSDWNGWYYPFVQGGSAPGEPEFLRFYETIQNGTEDTSDDTVVSNCFSYTDPDVTTSSADLNRYTAFIWSEHFIEFSTDMYVRINISYDASADRIKVRIKYHTNATNTIFNYNGTNLDFRETWLTYTLDNVVWKGRMYFALGAENSKVELDYILRNSGVYYNLSQDDFTALSGEFAEVPNSAGTHDVYSNAGYSFGLLNNKTLTSGTYSVDITGVGAPYNFLGGDSVKNDFAGILFNYSETNNSTYRFYYRQIIKWDNGSVVREVVVDEVKNGEVKRMYSNYFTAEYNEYSPYNFKVVMKNGIAYCYMKNNLVYHFKPTLPGNRVGIMAGSVFTKFNNYQVTNNTSLVTADTLIIGHSYMERWYDYNSDLSTAKANHNLGNIVNIGIGGSVAKHWSGFKEEISQYGANKLIYMIGINDVNQGYNAETIVSDITELLLYLKEQNPNLEVVLVTINHNTFSLGNAAKISATNVLIKELCANYAWISCADVEYAFCNTAGNASTVNNQWFTDTLHLTDAAYAKLANAIDIALDKTSDPSLSSAALANAKKIKIGHLDSYSEEAYTPENWALAKSIYNSAVNQINALTSTSAVENFDLTSIINELDAIERITDSFDNEILDSKYCITWETDEFRNALNSSSNGKFNIAGDGHRINDYRLYSNFSFDFMLSDNNTEMEEVGILFRADQTELLGINGYLINFVTKENFIQVYYMNDGYSLPGTPATVTYLGGWVYPKNVEDTLFKAIVEDNFIYIYEASDYYYGGKNAYGCKVDLTNGGTYPLYEYGGVGIFAWDKNREATCKLTIDNIHGDNYINHAILVNDEMNHNVNSTTYLKNGYSKVLYFEDQNYFEIHGEAYKMHKGLILNDFILELNSNNFNQVPTDVGFFIRARVTGNGGITGYRLNYSYNSDGYLFQVNYVTEYLNTKGVHSDFIYLNGIVHSEIIKGEKVIVKVIGSTMTITINGISNTFDLSKSAIDPSITVPVIYEGGFGVFANNYVQPNPAPDSFSGILIYNRIINDCSLVGHKYIQTKATWSGTNSCTFSLKCNRCGATTSQSATSITNAVTTNPTCTVTGIRTYTATYTYNGYTFTSTTTATVPATGHTTVNGGTSDVHTKCSVCGVTISTSHSYSSSVSVAATCTTMGTTRYTCSCGYSYTSQDIAVNPNNHTGSVVNGGTSGVHTKYNCCGATVSTTHSYTVDSGVKYTDATCTAKQKNYLKCSCGYNPKSASYVVEVGSVNSSNHTGSVINGGTSGVHTKYSCCGATVSTSHSYSSSVVTNPTCTTMGTTKYTCSCGYSYTSQDIAALGHNQNNSTVSNQYLKSSATCTSAAVYYKSCSRCGQAGTSTFTHGGLAAHSFTSYVNAKSATCTGKTTATRTCTVCGVNETINNVSVPVLATEHNGIYVNGAWNCCNKTGLVQREYAKEFTNFATDLYWFDVNADYDWQVKITLYSDNNAANAGNWHNYLVRVYDVGSFDSSGANNNQVDIHMRADWYSWGNAIGNDQITPGATYNNDIKSWQYIASDLNHPWGNNWLSYSQEYLITELTITRSGTNVVVNVSQSCNPNRSTDKTTFTLKFNNLTSTTYNGGRRHGISIGGEWAYVKVLNITVPYGQVLWQYGT